MTSFDLSRMLSFDLETTSVDTSTAKIVTSALVSIDETGAHKEELLADPGIEIPAEASRIHGITTEYARANGRPHEEVLAHTISRIEDSWRQGMTLIVYNAAYDLSVLHCLTNGEFLVTGPVFDPYVVDIGMDPHRRGGRTLTKLCDHYRVKLENAHEATSDALASARIAWKQVHLYPELSNLEMDELMVRQATWHADYKTRLQKYFESQNRATGELSKAWPMKKIS